MFIQTGWWNDVCRNQHLRAVPFGRMVMLPVRIASQNGQLLGRRSRWSLLLSQKCSDYVYVLDTAETKRSSAHWETLYWFGFRSPLLPFPPIPLCWAQCIVRRLAEPIMQCSCLFLLASFS
jgi:hypothetical protein